MPEVHRLAATTILVALLWLSGCGGAEVKRYNFLAQAPTPKVAVILAPEFFFRAMEPFDQMEKWLDLAQVLQEGTGLLIIGPDEFQVLAPGGLTSVLNQTDLIQVLRPLGVDPNEVVVIKVCLTEAWQQAQTSISNAKGASRAGAQAYESAIDLAVDFYHLGTNNPLLSLSGHRSKVVLEMPTVSDRRPDLTEFAREAWRQVGDLLRTELKVPAQPARKRPAVAQPLTEVLAAKGEGVPSLAERMADKDEIDRELILGARLGYRYPLMGGDEARRVKRLTEGLLVLSPGGCAGLQTGDVALQVEGRPLMREYQLARALERPAGAPGRILIERNGEKLEVAPDCR